MKPFNLEAALAGAKVVTRDGREVKIAGYNPDAGSYYKIAGWLERICLGWNELGKYDITTDHSQDLFMAPTERKEWVVRYNHGTPIPGIESYVAYSGPFDSIEKAQKFANDASGTIHEITVIE